MAPSLSFAALAAVVPLLQGSISCLNEAGNFVDYFAALKGNAGTDVHYHDASSSGHFKSGSKLDSTNSAIVRTVKQLYGSLGSSYAYALYNDAADDGKTSNNRAHSKGVILFDGSRGFWLVHSDPKWPSRKSSGYKGLPGTVFAQSYLCMSFRISQLETIAQIQLMQWPQIYDSGLSKDLEGKLPNFKAWIEGNKSKDTQAVTSLKTYSGRTFTSYGKSDDCGCELYADIVAKGLNGDLYVESWQNGASEIVMPNCCTKSGCAHNVINIKSLNFTDGRAWGQEQDHSKWAITSSRKTTHWTCIGDINRQSSQNKRGGGTICHEDANLWGAFNEIVDSYEKSCDKLAALPTSTGNRTLLV